MPKQKSKEDTWNPAELAPHLAKAGAEATSGSSSKDGSKKPSRDKRAPADGASAAAASSSDVAAGGGDRHRRKEKDRHVTGDAGESRKDKEHHRSSRDSRDKTKEDRSRRRDDDGKRDERKKERTSRDGESKAATGTDNPSKDEKRRHRDDKDRRREDKEHGREEKGEDGGRRRHRDDKESREKREHRDRRDKGEGKERHRESKDDRGRDDRKEKHRDGERKHRSDEKGDKAEESRHGTSKESESRHKSDDKDKHGSRKHRDGEDKRHREEASHGRTSDEERHKREKEERRERRRKREEEKEAAAAKKDEPESTEKEKVKRREAELLAQLQAAEKDEKHHNDKGRRKHPPQENEGSDEDVGDEVHGRIPAAPAMESGDEIEEQYDYDDDFEEYEEDFEDYNEDESGEEEEEAEVVPSKEVLEISQAMRDENERLLSRKAGVSKETPVKPSKSRHGGKFLDFSAAKKKQVSTAVAQKARRRGQELAQLIELDVVGIDLFELAPQTEYELYMKRFGTSNTAQVAVQCNDDVIEQEVQTDDIPTVEKWTQSPAVDLQGKGVGAGTGVVTAAEEEDVLADFLSQQVFFTSEQSKRLNSFLQKAGQLCNMLLDEQAAALSSAQLQPCPEKSEVSSGYTPLHCSWPCIADRYAVCTDLAEQQDHLLLSAFSPSASSAEIPGLRVTSGVVGLWHLSNPFAPHRLLTCQSSQVTCCCFSPGKPVLAIAGTVDGAVVVWDLREAMSLHRVLDVSDDAKCVCQMPTFSTDGTSLSNVHSSSVVDIVPLATSGSPSSPSHQSGVSFQLASLDEWSIVKIWVVVESAERTDQDPNTDIGMHPSARVRLIHSATISLSPLMTRAPSLVRSHCIRFQPGAANRFLAGTDAGSVLHGLRFKSHPIPNHFTSPLEAVTDIVSLDVSPWQQEYFLAGCSDGSVRLHHISKAVPLATWSQFVSSCTGVVCIRWLPCRPCVFMVVDKSSQLLTWDLSVTDTRPVSKDQFASFGRLGSFSVMPDMVSSKANRPAEIVMSFESGQMAIHSLTPQFSKPVPDEEKVFSDFLSNLI